MNNQNQPPIGSYMTNAKGHLVPVAKVPEIDRLRDETVREAIAEAEAMSRQLADFKAKMFGDVQAFIDLSGEKYGAKMGGEKGNVTLINYAGTLKVQRSVQESITFDERLQVAKKLIDECIIGWAQGANDNLRALVNDAFQVDAEGRVSIGRILGLRRLDITEEKWLQAMKAIGDAMQTTGSSLYIRFYKREGGAGEWIPIPLNLAVV